MFPFGKFPESDPILGPEMKSTGEVMGTGRTFGEAYAKSQAASGVRLPTRGVCLISVRDRDKEAAVDARAPPRRARLRDHRDAGHRKRRSKPRACRAGAPLKVREGRPHIVDMIKNDEIDLIINTTEGKRAIRESHSIRREAELRKVTYYTTVAAAHATLDALDHLEDHDVNRLQDLHRELGAA